MLPVVDPAPAAVALYFSSTCSGRDDGSSCSSSSSSSNKCNTLFCRSGLMDTYSAGFKELPVYRAFNAFLQLAGSTYFKAVILESPQAYAYVLNYAAGTPTHVLAWRPIPVGEIMEDPADKADVQFDAGFAGTAT